MCVITEYLLGDQDGLHEAVLLGLEVALLLWNLLDQDLVDVLADWLGLDHGTVIGDANLFNNVFTSKIT